MDRVYPSGESAVLAVVVGRNADEGADVRINTGVAQLVKAYDKQPDCRVEQVWNWDGELTGTVETRMVPDGLECNVDLPPTKAGGKPKDEEHVTDEEKERAKLAEAGNTDSTEDAGTKSVDAPKVNKMVNRPSAKT